MGVLNSHTNPKFGFRFADMVLIASTALVYFKISPCLELGNHTSVLDAISCSCWLFLWWLSFPHKTHLQQAAFQNENCHSDIERWSDDLSWTTCKRNQTYFRRFSLLSFPWLPAILFILEAKPENLYPCSYQIVCCYLGQPHTVDVIVFINQ